MGGLDDKEKISTENRKTESPMTNNATDKWIADDVDKIISKFISRIWIFCNRGILKLTLIYDFFEHVDAETVGDSNQEHKACILFGKKNHIFLISNISLICLSSSNNCLIINSWLKE